MTVDELFQCNRCGATVQRIYMKEARRRLTGEYENTGVVCNTDPVHFLLDDAGPLTLVSDGFVVRGMAYNDSEFIGYVPHFMTCGRAQNGLK